MTPTILLTFDVEDWFQVENFKQCIPFSVWPNCEVRIEKNIHRILDLLDSINSPSALRLTPNAKGRLCAMRSAPYGTLRSTFFVLGWIAERLPQLVREIQARGHEVASHGFYHELCRDQSGVELKNDLERSKKLLEDITGNPVYGYRAPSFSIDHDILKCIEDAGYFYDSSFNSFRFNRRYGQVKFTGNGRNGISFQISDIFFELPISNLTIGKRVVPWGGGGYFRLIPFLIFKSGVESILKKDGSYLFYLHPWEIDPDQPKVTDAKILYKFRHYTNLDKTLSKFSLFLENFQECHFQTCYEYLKSQQQNHSITPVQHLITEMKNTQHETRNI